MFSQELRSGDGELGRSSRTWTQSFSVVESRTDIVLASRWSITLKVLASIAFPMLETLTGAFASAALRATYLGNAAINSLNILILCILAGRVTTVY